MNASLRVLIAIFAACPPTISLAGASNENSLIKQIAHGLASSETALACRLRTPEWHKSVLIGFWGFVRVDVMSEHPKWSDLQINAAVGNILQAAKIEAATEAQFEAPTQAQCDALKDSKDMQEMDAAAKIGLMVGAVNGQ